MESCFNKLLTFYNRYNIDMSVDIFGEDLGKHLYSKWLHYDENVIFFINSLDRGNKNILFNYIENIS
jgi:hypothetical protein